MMKIVITLKELQDNYDWSKACEILRLNPYCLKVCVDEVEMESMEVVVNREQAIEIGIIKGNRDDN